MRFRFDRTGKRLYPTSFRISSVSTDIARISAATLLSRGINKIALNKFSHKFDSSTLSFLLSSGTTLISHLNSPVTSTVETIAWSIILPASLTLSIWSTSSNSDDSRKSSTTTSMISMLIAFVFGSIGSTIGALFGGLFVKITNIKLLPICSCLAASYIGGTANFFETASVLSGELSTGLVSDIAAVDIGIMVLFFSILQYIQSNKDILSFWNYKPTRLNSYLEQAPQISRPKIKPSMMIGASIMSIVISLIANQTQKYFSVMGLSIIFVTALSFFMKTAILSRVESSENQETYRHASNFFIDIFYSAIGLSLDYRRVLGLGFPALGMISIILSIHLIVVLLSSYAWNSIVNKTKPWLPFVKNFADRMMIDLDTAILASNACVGGSATAAGMAGQIRRSDLIVPASTAGIIGYMLGTQTGLAIHRILK